MMKWVEMRTLEGQIIVTGFMGKETYMHFIRERAGTGYDEQAKELWEEAAPNSLADYIYNIKVRVTEHTA